MSGAATAERDARGRRPSVLALLGAALAAALMGLATGCGGDEPTPATASVSITAPAPAAQLTSADDVSSRTAGVQVLVVAQFGDAPTAASVEVRNTTTGSLQPFFVDAAAGEVNAEVTLAVGVNRIAAVVVDGGVDVAVATVEVTLAADPPRPAVRIETPRNRATLPPEGDLDEDTPGYQTTVVGATTALADGVDVTLDVNGEAQVTRPVSNNVVRFGDVTLPSGTVELRAWATVNDQVVEATHRVTVDVGTCAVRVVPTPTGRCDVTTTTADADPALDGVQVDYTVESDCADRRLAWDGARIGATASSDGASTFRVTVTHGAHTVTGSAAQGDRTGETAALAHDARLDAVGVEVDAPAPLTVESDEAPSTSGLQRSFSGRATAPDGATVSVRSGSSLGTATVRSGAWRSTRLTFIRSGEFDVEVTLDDGCGQQVVGTAALRVTLRGDDLRIASPAPDAVLGPVHDLEPDLPGVSVMATVTGGAGLSGELAVECAPEGDSRYQVVGAAPLGGEVDEVVTTQVPVRLPAGLLDCRIALPGPGVVAGAFRWDVDLVGPEVRVASPSDGAISNGDTVTLIVAVDNLHPGEVATIDWSFSDSAFERANEVEATLVQLLRLPEGDGPLRLRVTDAVGNASEQTLGLVVDRTPPVVVPLVPRAGGTLRVSDLRADGPTLQLAPRALATGAVGGSVCLSMDGRAPRCVTPEFDGEVALPLVDLLPGENRFVLSAEDRANNTVFEEGSFVADVAPPRVQFVSPVDGFSTTELDPLRVEVSSDVAAGTPVTLALNGRDVATVPLAPTGRAIFESVNVPPGDQTLSARASDARGTGVASVSVLLESFTPAVRMTAPSSGTVFALTSVDASADDGFQVAVTAVAAGLNDRVALVEADCDNYAAAVDAIVDTGSVSAVVTLPAVGTCSIRVTGRTRGGQIASDAVTVRVDREAPAIVWDAPRPQAMLFDDASDSPGFQLAPRVRVVGAEAGAPVVFRVNGGAAVAGTSVGADGLAVGPMLTVPGGFASLAVEVVDGAGNAGGADVAFAAAPADTGAFVETPATGALLGTAADIDVARPGLQRDVEVRFDGALRGAVGRVCVVSSDATLYPDACAGAGTRVAASAEIEDGRRTFAAVTLPEGTRSLGAEVVLFDAIIPPRGASIVTVDTAPPTLRRLTSPSDANSDGQINRSESQAFGGVSVRAELDGIENGRPVTLRNGGAAIATATTSGQVASFTVTLAEGVHRLRVDTSDAAGNALVSSSELALTVDTVAPAIQFVAPTSGRALTGADDEDGGTDGLQFTVRLSTDAPAGSAVALSAQGSFGTRDLGVTTTSTGTALRRVSLGDGAQTIVALVSDAAGNRATTSVTVSVTTVASSARPGDVAQRVGEGAAGDAVDANVLWTTSEAALSAAWVANPDGRGRDVVGVALPSGIALVDAGGLSGRISAPAGASSGFGVWMASPGDVDGDGRGDLVVGDESEQGSAAYVFTGLGRADVRAAATLVSSGDAGAWHPVAGRGRMPGATGDALVMWSAGARWVTLLDVAELAGEVRVGDAARPAAGEVRVTAGGAPIVGAALSDAGLVVATAEGSETGLWLWRWVDGASEATLVAVVPQPADAVTLWPPGEVAAGTAAVAWWGASAAVGLVVASGDGVSWHGVALPIRGVGGLWPLDDAEAGDVSRWVAWSRDAAGCGVWRVAVGLDFAFDIDAWFGYGQRCVVPGGIGDADGDGQADVVVTTSEAIGGTAVMMIR